MNQFDNTLVSVEGIDKSGGSTLCRNLKENLNGEWVFSKEPSEGKYGRIVRETLQSDDDPTLSDFFLFCADRADHIESLIGPKLEDETVDGVVLDRYNLSTYAYQSPIVREHIYSGSGIRYVNNVVSEWVINPDVTIVLDIPVEEAFRRMETEREMYERRESLEEARTIYNTFAEERPNVVRVDGMQKEEEVLQDALEVVDEIRD